MFEDIRGRALRVKRFAIYRCGHRERVVSGGPMPNGLHQGCEGGINERGIERVEAVWPRKRSIRLAAPCHGALPL